MADEEQETMDISLLLPLDASPIWADLLEEEDRTLGNVKNLYREKIFQSSNASWDAQMNDSYFKLRARLANYQTESGTHPPSLADPPVPALTSPRDPDNRLDGDVGNLGNAGGAHREEWFDLLLVANGSAILDNPKLDLLTPSEWGSTGYKPHGGLPADTAGGRAIFKNEPRAGFGRKLTLGSGDEVHTPDLFMLRSNSLFAVPYYIVRRVVSLHNRLFGSNISALSNDRVRMRMEQDTFRAIMDNIQYGLAALDDLIEARYVSNISAEDQETAELMEETELAEGVGRFVLEPLTARERRAIMNQDDYQQYFTTTFNKEAIVTIPILQNFYLTTKYFQNISDSFQNTNNLILEILLSTIRNNDDYKKEPEVGRTAGTQGFNSGGLPDPDNFGVQAKDFILKMILMTPVNILKGLAELIDPHVALSKLIKTGSGFAFNQLELALDPAAEGITEAQKAVMEELGASEEELEAFTGPSGNDLLKLILCLIDLQLQENVPVPGPPWGPYDDDGVPIPPDPRPDNFYPRIGEKGIDFTGTIMGMFMIPPSPIGLIYLLLGLIKNNELETTEDVIDVTPEGEECGDVTSEGGDTDNNEEE